MFHCAAGKDRTGILARLLLCLAGVEKKDILSNYEILIGMTHVFLVDY
nr:tyrosine-protein phosphatase [Halalkalibacter urbisdiaboli]